MSFPLVLRTNQCTRTPPKLFHFAMQMQVLAEEISLTDFSGGASASWLTRAQINKSRESAKAGRCKQIVHLSLLPLVPQVSSRKPQAEIWKAWGLFFSGQNLNRVVTQWLPLWDCVLKMLFFTHTYNVSQIEIEKLVTYKSILNLFLCWMKQLLKGKALGVTGEVNLFYTDTVDVCTGVVESVKAPCWCDLGPQSQSCTRQH